MTDIKVCLISSGLIKVPPRYGGAVERYVYYTSKSLGTLGVEADVIDAKYSAKDPDEERMMPRIIRLRRYAIFSSSILSELAFGLAVKRTSIFREYDIIHANTSIPGFFVVRHKHRGERPFIYTCHRSSWAL